MSSIKNLKIDLHSEAGMAKRFEKILDGGIKEANTLINSCKKRKDAMWSDHKNSDSKKEKYIRTTERGSALERMLDLIDGILLKPYDSKLPPFIYGGVTSKSSIGAAVSVLRGKSRFLLKLDMKRFYEQITKPRIVTMLVGAGCTGEDFTEWFASLFCVPEGPKGSKGPACLARGFATSTRIATWVALPFMIAVESHVKRVLKRHNPRVAFFVDDIGISVQNVAEEKMLELEKKILEIAEKYNIEINKEKTKIYAPDDEQEILGVAKLKDGFFPGKKTRARRALKVKTLQGAATREERATAHRSLRGFSINKKTIKRKSKMPNA